MKKTSQIHHSTKKIVWKEKEREKKRKNKEEEKAVASLLIPTTTS